ncbi:MULTISPECIES: hypothetical protein [unclassified Haloferax]|uniref:hypothetical protein n=1 Tax=unclassified Haloferax TaxID=2625095 RepID=UPI000E36C6A3|nr:MULTISPECIES: hypothetical protein [unclassified Haloferax]RDZ34078.1 hypothetical protein C5B88_15725 [Haloferax sp. Atlit-24N]RLM41577.1 hypothetical protein DVK04_14660 [Haloferax sp. Atlit-105R]
MVSTFDPSQNTGLRDGPEFDTLAPTAETTSNGLLDGIQDSNPTTSTLEQQSQQPSLGEAIGKAVVLVGAAWLVGKILGELFGSSADLTAVEEQILASA